MSRQDTRDRIVEAAAALFHEHGYHATGLSKIIAASRSGAGSFYHFFSSKEDLLAAILDRYRERLEAEIVAPARQAADPLERAFGMLGFYRDFLVATDFRLGCPIGNLAGELADSHPHVRERIDELFSAWKQAVAGFLREACATRPLTTDPDELAVLFISAMEGGVMQARVARSLEPYETTVRLLRDYVAKLVPPQENPP